MTDKAKAARAAYARQWRKDHPGKNREYCARHWEKKAKEQEQKEGAAEE